MDDHAPHTDAVLVRCGRVEALGAEATAKAGDIANRCDMRGACIVPGFTESHIHYFDWALALKRLMLDKAECLEDVLDAVAAESAKPERDWVIGYGWYEGDWPQARIFTKRDLDAVCPDKPAILWRADLHLAVANSAALAAAGISRGTPQPAMGRIDMDENGEPTGVLRDWGINPVRELALASLTDTEIDEAFADAQSELHRYGITAVHDLRLMGGIEAGAALAAWQRLRHSGRMRLRSWCCMAGEHLEYAIRLGLRTGLGDEWLRMGHFKVYSDGSMGAKTAWVLDPYCEASGGGAGLPMFAMDEIGRMLRLAHECGNSLTIHAIGDRAVRDLAALLAEAESCAPSQRFAPDRIEHMQMVRTEDLHRYAALAPGCVAVSVQPSHLVLDMDMIDGEFGDLGRFTYPFASLLRAGLTLAFGSDCPVTHFDPLRGMHAAITRNVPGCEAEPWHSHECITAEEALRAYTMGPAASCGLAEEQGSITPGKLADFAVLSKNPLDIPAAELPDVRVLKTIVAGEVVHAAPENG
ncbi:amidohydrolase [Oceanidesulfovibrio indonesiensis]|nr:amidohydrolase [Oceanidesulfovibrio indonesiensis]